MREEILDIFLEFIQEEDEIVQKCANRLQVQACNVDKLKFLSAGAKENKGKFDRGADENIKAYISTKEYRNKESEKEEFSTEIIKIVQMLTEQVQQKNICLMEK